MDQKEAIENAVISFLVYHKPKLLHTISPLLEQKLELLKTEDSSFHSEIEAQFETLIRREIAEYIAINMQFDPEQVYLIVETLNVKEFLGAFEPIIDEDSEEENEI
jgi:transcription antitermination factor NusG